MNKLMLAGAVVGLGAALAATPALAQSKQNRQEAKFVHDAIEGNFAEQSMGDLAQQNGQSQAIKDFGAELKRDHSAANDKVMPLSQQVGVRAPSEPSAKHKQDYEKLAKLSGARFDQAFAQHMVMDHKQDITKYQRAASGSGPVASYAQETLPVLQRHLSIAQTLANGNRGAMGAGSGSDMNMNGSASGSMGSGGNPSMGNGNSTGTGYGSGSSGGRVQQPQ
jgi:putative membrane protein